MACQQSPSDKISVGFKLNRSQSSLGALLPGNRFSFRALDPPSSALSHDCYLFAISGNGIESDIKGSEIRSGYDSACLGWGTMSSLKSVEELTEGVELSVPAGTSRRVALFGTTSDGGSCGDASIADRLMGTTSPIYVLGDETVSLFQNAQISLTNRYNPDNPTDQVAVCAPAPKLTSVSVSNVSPGDTVTLTGENFLRSPSITVGEVPCAVSETVSTTSATCVVPAAASGTQGITFRNRGGKTDSLASALSISQIILGAWSFVERDIPDTNGVDTSKQLPRNPHLAVHRNRLWLTFWQDIVAAPDVGHAYQYDPDDSGETEDWDAFPQNIDLGGTPSVHSTFLYSFEDELFALFSNGSTLRAAKLNTNQDGWISADNSAGVAVSQPFAVPSQSRLIGVDDSLYAFAIADFAAGTQTQLKAYRYLPETSTWTDISNEGARNPLDVIPGDFTGGFAVAELENSPWAAWTEGYPNQTGNLFAKAYLASGDRDTDAGFGGHRWVDKGGSLSILTNQSAGSPSLVSHDGTLYLAWEEDDGSGNLNVQVAKLTPPANSGVRLASRETGIWNRISPAAAAGVHNGGMNQLVTGNASSPVLASFQGKLYLAWAHIRTDTPLEKTLEIYRYNEPEEGASIGAWVPAYDSVATEGVQFPSQTKVIDTPAFMEFEGALYLTYIESDNEASDHQVRVLRGGAARNRR